MIDQVLQLVYSSVASRRIDDPELEDILAVSRRRNGASDVSGLLLFHGGTFLQVLEGEPYAVLSLFQRIGKDPRHTDVTLLLKRMVRERGFGEWRMGYLKTGAGEHPDGFLDYIRDLPALVEQGDTSDRTVQLVGEFLDGRWRRRIR